MDWPSGKERVRQLLLANVGRIVTAEQVRTAAEIIERTRRLREFRDER